MRFSYHRKVPGSSLYTPAQLREHDGYRPSEYCDE